MASLFDQLTDVTNPVVFNTFGDAVVIDTTEGTAIVTPDNAIPIGGGVQLVEGAHLMFKVADFPDAGYHSSVTHGTSRYLVLELDDVDHSGCRKARMAKA